ncbi:hypothetical protein AXG93_1200s1830 [Marchantia polymorpha subsp. ruderalis]|uniref:Uncharacterized protein n=1 Tax=Marchantia polymorpha subsp. ruderalis TaxID=1480154 RepID=A0A176WL14_MARPO|nr:hypothetical protein AXG93_1200s1830 [Marchantia polymorpha subsp. ruderalis]
MASDWVPPTSHMANTEAIKSWTIMVVNQELKLELEMEMNGGQAFGLTESLHYGNLVTRFQRPHHSEQIDCRNGTGLTGAFEVVSGVGSRNHGVPETEEELGRGREAKGSSRSRTQYFFSSKQMSRGVERGGAGGERPQPDPTWAGACDGSTRKLLAPTANSFLPMSVSAEM